LDIFKGRISSSGFSGGDRVVIGDWMTSPLGEFTNVMWAKPNGRRILLSPSEAHAEFVSEIYDFEEVRVVEIKVLRGRKKVSVKAGDLQVRMEWGFSLLLPFWRPLWFTRIIEGPIGRVVFGSKTYGRTKDGRKEWYSVRGIARLNGADAIFEGRNLGEMTNLQATACFGFSEPPARPSSVKLSAFIE